MFKSLSWVAAATIAMMGSSASAATYTFSFGNVNGATTGLVSGTIELADGDGTFAATSVVVDSAPTSLGYTLSLDFLDPANGYGFEYGNSFTVAGGNIVDANFGRINNAEGLFLSNDLASNWSFLNVVGSKNESSGVSDQTSASLIFAPASVPLPASLPLLLAGLGGVGMIERRKRKQHA